MSTYSNYEALKDKLDSYGLLVNPITSADLVNKLGEDDELRNALYQTDTYPYKLYSDSYLVLRNSLRMMAKSVDNGVHSDNIIINKILSKERIESPDIWIESPSSDGWEWIESSQDVITEFTTNGIYKDLIAFEWSTKLGNDKLLNYLLVDGSVKDLTLSKVSKELIVDLFMKSLQPEDVSLNLCLITSYTSKLILMNLLTRIPNEMLQMKSSDLVKVLIARSDDEIIKMITNYYGERN